MSDAALEDWDEVIESLQRDLELVSDETDDEEVSAAIEEVWAIVDAFEERVGPVDVDRIATVLGADREASESPIDESSIPAALIVDDPERAAGLSRLVSLLDLDAATDYQVGRLWEDDVEVGSGDSGSGTGRRSASRPSDDTAADNGDETDEVADELRSKLGDAFSGFRDQIDEARAGFDEPSGPADDEDGDAHGEWSSQPTGSPSSRSSRPLSTVPSSRSDVSGLSHVSTVPDRG